MGAHGRLRRPQRDLVADRHHLWRSKPQRLRPERSTSQTEAPTPIWRSPPTSSMAASTRPESARSSFRGCNTYTGPTTVNGGTLLVNNTSGSGTGSGNVAVNARTRRRRQHRRQRERRRRVCRPATASATWPSAPLHLAAAPASPWSSADSMPEQSSTNSSSPATPCSTVNSASHWLAVSSRRKATCSRFLRLEM